MKTRFLFPNSWRKIGYVLFLIGTATFVVNNIYDPPQWQEYHQKIIDNRLYEIIVDDFLILTLVTGLLLIGFSKEKVEDEQIAQTRLDSLQWAIYFNYLVLIICTIFINGLGFWSVMTYNIITPLLFFTIRFRWKIYQANKQIRKEENPLS